MTLSATLFAFDIPMALYNCYIWVIPLVIFGALFGLRWKVGMWGNSISLGAVLFSILVAVGWWEDLAFFLKEQFPAWLFVADGVAIWTIFIVSLLILDTATRLMSSVKVKYADVLERVGNGIALFLLSTVLYAFFLFAEEVGPVGAKFNTDTPGDSVAVKMFRMLSDGNLSGFTKVTQFDDRGNFRELHLKRRQALMYNALSKENVLDKIKADEADAAKAKRHDRSTVQNKKPEAVQNNKGSDDE
jgi:signal transduction histidine kinase